MGNPPSPPGPVQHCIDKFVIKLICEGVGKSFAKGNIDLIIRKPVCCVSLLNEFLRRCHNNLLMHCWEEVTNLEKFLLVPKVCLIHSIRRVSDNAYSVYDCIVLYCIPCFAFCTIQLCKHKTRYVSVVVFSVVRRL